MTKNNLDDPSEPDVDLENQYYNSKSLKEKDPKAALESFQRVLDLENGEKGMKNDVKGLFEDFPFSRRVGFQSSETDDQDQLSTQQLWWNDDKVINSISICKSKNVSRYKQLLTYIKSAVTRNHSEKSINSILDYISTSKQVRPEFCQQ